MKNNFYVVLPSNSCPSTQPDNIAASFLIDIENTLTLGEGDWEVALTEFSLNYLPKAQRKPMTVNYLVKNRLHHRFTLNYINKIFSIGDSKYKLSDPFITHMSVDDRFIVRSIAGKLQILCTKPPFRIMFNNLADAQYLGFYDMVRTSDTATLTADYEHRALGDMQVEIRLSCNETTEVNFDEYKLPTTDYQLVAHFTNDYAHVFKLFKVDSDGFINFILADVIEIVMLAPSLSGILGFDGIEDFHNNDGKLYQGIRKPRLENAFTQLIVYSSIIEPILVGGNKVPLLRTIWVHSKYNMGEVLFEQVDHPMYLAVSSNSINNIEVQIRSDSGELIPFPYGSKSNITLHFRKNE